ncbi:MAG: malectin domain-containing carbohydrate-binding protein, partial [Planctomycetota bacterium]
NDEGIYTFWHSRSNCYVDHVSGGGLMIKPPQAIYCKCMWSLPFTVAMGEVATLTSSAPKFAQPGPSLPVKHLNVDFGANGDRRDDKGQLWISSTNRFMNHKLLLHYGIKLMMYDGWQDAGRSARFTKTEKADVPFVFASSLTGLKSCILPVARPEDGAGTYKVRLGFAAPPGDASGKRIFDVRLNGKTVLENFDIASETGAVETAVWKEFTMELKENLVVELVSAAATPTYEQLPLLNGVQILRQEMKGGGIAVSGDVWLNLEVPEKELSIRVGNSHPESLEGKFVLEGSGGLEARSVSGGAVSIAPFSSVEVKIAVKGKAGMKPGVHQLVVKLVAADGKTRFEQKIPVEWIGKLSREVVRGGTRTILSEALQKNWGNLLRPNNLRNEFLYVSEGGAGKSGGAATYLWFNLPGHLRSNASIHSARLRLQEAKEFSLLQPPPRGAKPRGGVEDVVRRLEGPPWPDFNKVKYPDLPKPQAESLRLKRDPAKPSALEVELPPQWRGGGKDGNIYFVLEPGTAQGTAYWSNSASKRDRAPSLVIDYEKK